ncbi:MAG: tannase/feruloyl esterase family alpha/beta hydrolase [Bryobacteraceae bacterium]
MTARIFVVFAFALHAQNGSQLLEWSPPSDDPAVKPKLGCADLRALTGHEFTVATAVTIPPAGDVPEHCRISGLIQPEIQFEVNLPATWNRRFYMFGNGGYAGENLQAPNRANSRGRALRHGFAVAQHNTGHNGAKEPLASFAVHRQKLYDYAFRGLHVTADSARKLISAYYGAGPARSYFDGCSTGGRQGLILAQRFPQDFDGIVVGAPVCNFTGTMINYAWVAQALAAAPIPSIKLNILAEKVYAVCDPVDGVTDGLIDDPRKCAFDPARNLPRCEAGDQPGCFTAPQIEALRKIYAGPTGGAKRLFPPWPLGAEALAANGRSAWDPWIVRDGQPTVGYTFGETFYRYMAFPDSDVNYDLKKFDFDKDPLRMDTIRQVLDAVDPDLTRFRERGGRIVMYYGWADQALNALMGVDYYESVRERMGDSTAGFFRLFMVPGMFHCTGGVGTSTFDALTPLIRWVEQGTAPDRLPAARVVSGKVVRSRPLCPYPQVAKYKGSGSLDDAVSFSCAAP